MRSDCIIDNSSHENIWEIKLHTDLLRWHRYTESPKPNETVEIGVTFSIRSYIFDSNEEVFMLNVRADFEWQDDRLKWNPSDYGGVNDTVISSMNIWAPGMRLLNVVDEDDSERYYYTSCQIKSDGQVVCSPRIYLRTWCTLKLAKWPLDTQTCLVDFGDWRINGKVRFKVKNPLVDFVRGNVQWQAVDIKQENIADSNIQIRLTFIIKRNGSSLVLAVVHPCVILSVFTTICLLLNVRDGLRLQMISFSLVCHLYLLSAIDDFVPIRGTDPPTILLFYRGSIAITTIGIILTFVLHGICEKKTLPPAWLSSVNEVVLVIREKLLMWPRWKCKEEKHSQEWTDFATLVNIVYVVVSIVAYISMYFKFIP
ncbi:neuronal acetylcholine receptor subunit beta-3-like [Manduca sexta]|uniref:neuronal acetylcholine receptor subunit beta-3-like n=1 Tax=Manduca sexta TaxID=7130 RepID=UPI001182A018|nr:neuronal acetylcholine receptor subunit beta-3-like [Manduca sexta]